MVKGSAILNTRYSRLFIYGPGFGPEEFGNGPTFSWLKGNWPHCFKVLAEHCYPFSLLIFSVLTLCVLMDFPIILYVQ